MKSASSELRSLSQSTVLIRGFIVSINLPAIRLNFIVPSRVLSISAAESLIPSDFADRASVWSIIDFFFWSKVHAQMSHAESLFDLYTRDCVVFFIQKNYIRSMSFLCVLGRSLKNIQFLHQKFCNRITNNRKTFITFFTSRWHLITKKIEKMFFFNFWNWENMLKKYAIFITFDNNRNDTVFKGCTLV